VKPIIAKRFVASPPLYADPSHQSTHHRQHSKSHLQPQTHRDQTGVTDDHCREPDECPFRTREIDRALRDTITAMFDRHRSRSTQSDQHFARSDRFCIVPAASASTPFSTWLRIRSDVTVCGCAKSPTARSGKAKGAASFARGRWRVTNPFGLQFAYASLVDGSLQRLLRRSFASEARVIDSGSVG
jgi:hypothetical protein